jgi:hypothetical protein
MDQERNNTRFLHARMPLSRKQPGRHWLSGPASGIDDDCVFVASIPVLREKGVFVPRRQHVESCGEHSFIKICGI